MSTINILFIIHTIYLISVVGIILDLIPKSIPSIFFLITYILTLIVFTLYKEKSTYVKILIVFLSLILASTSTLQSLGTPVWIIFGLWIIGNGGVLYFTYYQKKILSVVSALLLICILPITVLGYGLGTTLVGYCESKPVFYSPQIECDINSNNVFTRDTYRGENRKIEEIEVDCEEEIQIIDQSYVESQCLMFK